MSKNHSKIDCRDLFNKVLDLDLIDMNPVKKEQKILPKSPIINNFFISKKDYLKNKENSVENLYIKNQRRIIKRNSYNLYNSYKNNINVSFGDIIKIADKKYLVESYNPFSKLYKLKNLTTFTNHYFDLKNMNYSKLLSHDVKFDLETYEKKLLVKVKEIQKNIYKRRTLLKEKLKKYDYTLINTESESDYSSDWEDCSWEYCSDLEIPPLESDDEFDFIGDFTYNPIKPKINFPDNIFDQLERGEIINKPKHVEKTKFSDPLFDFFNSANIVEEYEVPKEKTIDDIDFSLDNQLKTSSFLKCEKNREINDPIKDFIDKDLIETHNKNGEIIVPVLKTENILYDEETSTELIKYKPIYDCKADIKEINLFDNDLRYGGFNNLWNFNNKVNIEEDDNQKIIFSTPINLFNTDNSKSFKPEKDMITPITNFLNENPIPEPYEKNLLEDIKVENIPQAYNKSSTGEKLAPIFDIDNNYFSMIREENIKNLDLTKIQPKIVVSKIIDNTEAENTEKGENTDDEKIKNELVNECVKDDTIDNSWGNYCQIM